MRQKRKKAHSEKGMDTLLYLWEMKKIVITGPECSGKSELSQALADYYHMPWVPEYARTYLTTLPRPYEASDLLAIARGQEEGIFDRESQFPDASWLFIDTWVVVLQIWYKYRFGVPPSFFAEMSDRHHIDHYLLCSPDLPWTDDPLRENPNDRDVLFEKYQEFLSQSNLPYTIISGRGSQRTQSAIQTLESLN